MKLKLQFKLKKPLVFWLTIVFCLMTGGLFVYWNLISEKESIINISSLPEDVIDTYFESFSEMSKSDNKENVLIVTSKVPLEDTYGATQIVSAPNYQYFLQYENENDRKYALNMFKTSNIKVSENKTYKFTNDGQNETASDYNSWGIKAMGLDRATELVETIDNLPKVTVAIIDTGLDMTLMNKYFPGKVNETYNVLDPNGEMVDEYGHGTHIAGTIAEGTPSNVKVLPIKVSTGEELSDVDIITAINYITYYEKADVINMSFGGYGYDEATEETRVAIEAAKEKGIISVAAAGNESTNEISYPSGFDNTISVSAVDNKLSLADYSNYGKMITFAAPGTDIKSIMSSDAEISINNGDDHDDDFETISGTSMATPHVACAVAVLKSINPNLGFSETVDVLKDHTTDIGAKGWDNLYGYGLIDFSGTKLCDKTGSSDCDAHSVFEKFVANGVEIGEVVLTPYNYGSLTNILATTISITSTNGERIEKKIGDLDIDDYQITGYNPYSAGAQTVTLTYAGLETHFVVENPANYEFGWEYSAPEYDESTTYGYALKRYKDHNLDIKTLYFPNTTSDGTPIVAVEESSDERCVFGNYKYLKTKDELINQCVNLVDAPNYTTIVLPQNIRQIAGMWVFGSILPYGIPGTLANLERIVSYADDLVLAGGNTFAGLKKLYSIEANILFVEDEMGGEEFSNDMVLSNITLSENNTTIPIMSFRGCQNLSEITIPESVQEIGSFAFANSSLTKLHIPRSVNWIGMGIFEETNQLESITVSPDNQWFYSPEGSNAIIETATDKLVAGSSSTIIPEGVKIIGQGALLAVNSLEIIIPEGVTTIETNAISNVDMMKILLPSSLESISNTAFNGVHHTCMSGRPFCSFSAFAFWVHRDSYALEWAIEEDYGYVIIEELDESSESKYISWDNLKTRARALDTINNDNTDVYIYFADKDGTYEPDPVRATVIGGKYYSNWMTGEESPVKHLVAGYNCFAAVYEIGAYHNMESTTLCTTIGKRIPEYTLPTGLEADPGQKLSEIALPDGFSWKKPNTVISGAGMMYYQATFTPEDTENYETVNDYIGIFVRTDKELIEPTINLNSSTLIRDDPVPITKEEITVGGFKPIDGDGDGYEITYIDYYYNDDYGKAYVYIELKMSDKQFESHYFMGGSQYWGDEIEADTVYSSSPFVGFYDGESHSISFNLGERYSQCSITYSEKDNGQYSLTTLPEYKEIGVYDVYYRIDCGGSHSFTGSNTVTINGFKISDLILRGNKLRVVSNKVTDLLNAIEIVGDEDVNFRILNNNGNEIAINDSTTISTGYVLVIEMGTMTYNYEIALAGDLTNDGLIDNDDFNAMRQHLIGTGPLNEIRLLAGEVSGKDPINSADLLRLKQHLLGIKSIE